MMTNGASASQSATAPSPYANPTIPVHGTWEFGTQTGNPWGYAPQMYDPRYGALVGFDPRFGVSVPTNDPRFGFAPIGPRPVFPPIDPRFGAPLAYDPRFGTTVPTYDPRFGPTIPTYDPRFGTVVPTYDPRFEPPVFGWGFDQSGPTYDPRLINRGAMQVPGLGFDGQPSTPWGGSYGFPGRGPEGFLAAGMSPASFGFGELPRFPGAVAPRLGVVGLPRDEEIEEMAQEALDHHPLIPLDADVDVKCESGQVTLTGKVPDKRIKRAAGEALWWIPGVTDVNNTIVVSGRRQAQATRRRGRQQPIQAGR